MANNKALSSVLLLTFATVVLFILINSAATTFAAEDIDDASHGKGKPKDVEPYKAVNEFCSQRKDKKDTEFCMRALKSDPRSAQAKDTVDLLLISVDLAVANTNKTQDYLSTLLKKEGSKESSLRSALKNCVPAYDLGVGELRIIPRELKDDPALASYDALTAFDALESCRDALKRNRITNHSILRRHKISTAYVRLCVEIAMNI